jgi:hypothetical protein
MRIDYDGCVDKVEFDQKQHAANVIIDTSEKGLVIVTTLSNSYYFIFFIGNGTELMGQVGFYYDSDEDREIFSRLRFYLEDKDQIWVLLPKQEVYM